MVRAIAYLWVGLILGVSFLATPIKFRAPTLTLPVALDVGRTTFHAFGKVEWVLSVALVAAALAVRPSTVTLDWLLVAVVISLVAVEALVLLPRLDLRVAAIIAGSTPPPSKLHLAYVGAEAVKVVALLTVAIWSARRL